jgi:hypothetical protein
LVICQVARQQLRVAREKAYKARQAGVRGGLKGGEVGEGLDEVALLEEDNEGLPITYPELDLSS